MEIILQVAVPAVLFVATYFSGRAMETRHDRLLSAGEDRNEDMIVMTIEDYPSEWQVERVNVVIGSVVVSHDYYRRVVGVLRKVVGGRLKVYEPLLARARREALLRMMNNARAQGFHHVVNVRLETARLANSRRGGKGTAGVEVVAYGTALELAA
jgi:uncharacterized protein YbjQ (UPF0145 family)